MRVLGLYLCRLYALRFLAVLLGLAGLLQLVDLMDRSDEILERGLGAAGMARYALLRLPLGVPAIVPIASLAAAVLTFAGLAGRSEIAAMRASGISLARLAVLLLPVALAAGAVQFVVADRVAPLTDAAFSRWWADTDPTPKAKGAWFRFGMDVVGVEAIAPGGAELDRVTIHQRGPDGLLTGTIEAGTARWQDGRWLLAGGRVLPPANPATFTAAAWNGPVPANMAELTRIQPELPVTRLWAILTGAWVGAEAETAYRTRLWRAAFRPFGPVLMLLLALPAAGGTRRSGSLPAGMAMGLAAGLSYLVLDGILAALGEAGTLPPVLAAAVPHAVFACIGGTVLLYAEG